MSKPRKVRIGNTNATLTEILHLGSMSRKKVENALISLGLNFGNFSSWYESESKWLAPSYRNKFFHSKLVLTWLEANAPIEDREEFARLYAPIRQGLRKMSTVRAASSPSPASSEGDSEIRSSLVAAKKVLADVDLTDRQKFIRLRRLFKE